MSPKLDELRIALRPVRRRWHRSEVARFAITGLLLGSVGSLVAALGRRLGSDVPLWAAWALPLFGAAIPLLWTLFRAPRWSDVAKEVDNCYRLKDRAVTALAFAEQNSIDGLRRLQIDDALQHLNRVDPAAVVPWRLPTRLWSAISAWGLAVVIASVPQGALEARIGADHQRLQDALNRQTAESLEDALLSELERLAEITGTPPPELLSLKQLASDVRERLERLKTPGQSTDEALAQLSELQSTLAITGDELGDPIAVDQLEALHEALSTAESLQPISDSLKRKDYQEAAEQLDAWDADQLSDIERSTLAEDLKSVAEQMSEAGADRLASAVRPLQEGLKDNDAQRANSAAGSIADQLRLQALKLALQAELRAQQRRVAESKGIALSGGNRVDPSDESKETFGFGKAGNPLDGNAPDLATVRRRESVTGVQGEGHSDRDTTRAEAGQGRAERPLQPAFRKYEDAAEEVMRKESLPIGYRHTIQRYFKSIRPE